ncbi:hypothetical protein [Hymenobacter jeollabukensis]|uniref:Uncharacterized protein n=1 Tax=Hymenobacter jeollabukensis TaxID=2025313 RepID=A0A5R8WVF2_9BACT|nr:hypothetical protein [Hymenobacter jeollabukensis]TLM96491.1 hypothetical protein FDY95_00380 [Hymenobacter jeollabukensis]
MAFTPPFFRHTPHMTGAKAPAPEPERYPFHDNDACPVGQEVKRSGEWQYYEPRTVEETRVRCPQCAALSRREA